MLRLDSESIAAVQAYLRISTRGECIAELVVRAVVGLGWRAEHY